MIAGVLLVAAPALLTAFTPAWAADPRWDTWQLMLWQDRSQAQLDGLRALGFTGAKLRGTSGAIDPAERAKRQRAGLPPYIENIATDFYAAYHRFVAGQAINAEFVAAHARYRAGDPTAFIRNPGLSDPAWLDRIRDRLGAVVRAEQPDHPLFYNLADESGIGDLAAAWDFDQSERSLAGFRTWLQGQYPDLAALNQEWGTNYGSWDDVHPMLTDAAIRQTNGNFAAWSDFKAWMDVAFARAVRAGTDAVHTADPAALAALEGGQIPGWGGYDYALLAPAVDVMEIYDLGEALDLAQAFNPSLIPLRTSFGSGPRETFDAWRNVLHGGRGEVVWDEADDVVGQDGLPGPRGLELSALAQAIRPVASLLHEASLLHDPVAELYSQASFRVQWLLDRQAGDHDWAARDAEREYDDNPWRASRRQITQGLAGLGVQPRIVTGPMIAAGALQGVKVLLLPDAIALSDQEVSDIKAFQDAGGTVLADTEPGLFDGHGRRRAAPLLPDVPHPQPMRPTGGPPGPDDLNGLEGLLHAAGVVPRAQLVGPDGQRAAGVEARWFQHPRGLLLTLQATVPWGGSPHLTIRLPGRVSVTDIRKGGAPVVGDRIEVALDAVEPTVLLVAPIH
jgi:hypothetical protein